jgi:hypothetical protein
MINPEKIKKLIFHSDKQIRSAVMEYFNDSFSVDTEILNLALDKYASLSDDSERYLLLRDSENLKLDMESLTKILSYIPLASINTRHLLEELLCYADASLLKQFDLDSIELSSDIRLSIYHKLALSAMSTEALLEELLYWCIQAEDKCIEECDHRLGNNIIRELVARNDLDENFIIEALTKTEPEEFSAYENYLFTLGGMRRMTALIPLFIDCLGFDGFICNEAQSALARIGTKEVVYNLARRFYFKNDDFKIYAIGVLEKIKLQQSEDLLLKFLKEETDFILKTFLTGALCKHGNPNALTQLFELMEEGGEDSLYDLGDYAYIPCLFNDEIISRMDF